MYYVRYFDILPRMMAIMIHHWQAVPPGTHDIVPDVDHDHDVEGKGL
jgi:hypothetical protein